MAPSRRHLLGAAALLVLVLGLGLGLGALGVWGGCGRGERSPAHLEVGWQAEGPLAAGAGRVVLQPPWPSVVAGYPPRRPEALGAQPPVHARALVLAAGGRRVGLVSLDLLLVPEPLVAAVRERTADLGLSGLLVVASHAHSSFGGYDARLAFQVAATGRFRPEALEAAVGGAAQALREAAAALAPVTLALGETHVPTLVRARSAGGQPDGRLTRLLLQGAQRPVAEVLVFAAHPTLVPRDQGRVDPDYPGRLGLLREGQGGVALVLQGASGNVSPRFDEGEGPERAGGYARALAAAAEAAGAGATAGTAARLAFAQVRLALPPPDGSRLVPSAVRLAADGVLCAAVPPSAEVSALQVGPLTLLALPGEPTVGAGARLAAASGATHVLGLAGGYVGYVETPEAVDARTGEARRQYFGRELLAHLEEAARLAVRAASEAPQRRGAAAP